MIQAAAAVLAAVLAAGNPAAVCAQENGAETLLEETAGLRPEDMSVELFGRVLQWMRSRWQEGQSVSIPAMNGEFRPEEISHLTSIVQKRDGTVNEQAFREYISVIRSEASKRGSKDLMAALSRRRDNQGYGG